MGKIQPLGVKNYFQGPHGICVIIQRLAHSHENNIFNITLASQMRQNRAHLAYNLSRGEVAEQPPFAGITKSAFERAPELRGNTKGKVSLFRYHHTLDHPTVFQGEKIFFSPILAHQNLAEP